MESGARQVHVSISHSGELATGLQEREWLKDMFGRFVSQEVAVAIRDGEVIIKGENRVVSVLFCDIREFTEFAERHTPQSVHGLTRRLVITAQTLI